MKAWNDIEQDPHKSICWTENSDWYLDHGIKIERFNDGKFEIKNTMLSSDNYKNVTPIQRQVFEEKGWNIGCYTVCIDTYTLAVDRLNNRIRQAANANRTDDLADFTARRERLLKKIYRYTELLNKLL